MINGSQWNKRIKESIPESRREDYMGNISLGIWFIRRLPDEREEKTSFGNVERSCISDTKQTDAIWD